MYPSSFVEILSPVLSWIPFVQHISGVRGGLSNIYLNQAVCNPKSTYDSSLTIVPCFDESVLLYSVDRDQEVDGNAYKLPLRNIFTVFMNTEHTYEDGFVMSSSAATKFQYICVHQIRFNSSLALNIKGGDIIKPMSNGWW